ncbi:MAG: 6-phospho-beta-glucosidase [Intrasporangium sp.]|uniref:6-phospho-beta-glucosidase n=1 Tax=Intrasporangium sp. TaxID=1925024 RepID=UPI00264865BE|nr:6-phospho-beta-glucosidase [Intrasporangium sp.]MDN5796005.1 6-phospho-beta-glucosidase [Intrasporangium sp.]
MRLTILGGGGFRVPLVYGAVLADRSDRRVTHVVLHDTDETRLHAIGHVLAAQAGRHTAADPGHRPPEVTMTTDLGTALEGAHFVFSAIRVGGLPGRTADERVALDLGLLGQETTGAGGVSYGLRTVPVAVAVAERVKALAPDAWVVNFTNPAGLVTQAMQQVLGDRVVGICDSALGVARRAAAALGHDLAHAEIDYAGLNHLGWLQGLRVDGRDVLPDLLADPDRLGSIEEGHLFGVDWLQTLGVLPNEYLHYYYFTRDAVAAITSGTRTRGEFLLGQQASFYAALTDSPGEALATWDRVARERNATYMQENRAEDESRSEQDIEGGGYEGVALALMAAIARDEPATLILNVASAGTLPGLPVDAVVEVPCRVTAAGPRPLPVSPLRGAELGLTLQVKAVEELTIRAALDGDPRTAVEALALHPLVDSVTVARRLLSGYRARIPSLDRVFNGT